MIFNYLIWLSKTNSKSQSTQLFPIFVFHIESITHKLILTLLILQNFFLYTISLKIVPYFKIQSVFNFDIFSFIFVFQEVNFICPRSNDIQNFDMIIYIIFFANIFFRAIFVNSKVHFFLLIEIVLSNDLVF